MSTVLVLTNSKDGLHSSVVIDKIKRRNDKVIRFDTDLITRGEHSLVINYSQNKNNIFKPLSGYLLEYKDSIKTATTTLLTPAHIANLNLVRNQPILLQRWIEKQYEVRVTCVGDIFFSVKLDCTNYQDVIDYRI